MCVKIMQDGEGTGGDSRVAGKGSLALALTAENSQPPLS